MDRAAVRIRGHGRGLVISNKSHFCIRFCKSKELKKILDMHRGFIIDMIDSAKIR